MIKLENITLRRGTQLLFADVNLLIAAKERIGIIGANGTGKSSLFALLLGELEADNGKLSLPNNLVIAHVAQEADFSDATALQFVMDGDTELRQLESALQKAEHEHDGHRIATIHERMQLIDAYTAPTRAAKILAGLGFSQEEMQRHARTFSGGWQMRLNLARALMARSDLLLLDEPTNHLDLDAILWLEDWLKDYPGTLLLISHDRDFLDHVVDHILHLFRQSMKLYSGNYSAFEKQRALDLQLQQAMYEKQQKKIAHMQAFVDRFRYKASKARQAQSRLKAIERMETVCAVQAESPLQFIFKEPQQAANPLLVLHKAEIGYPDKTVLNKVNFSISPTDRIGLLGPNGAGKSSLIKSLAGEIALKHGERVIGANVKIGYFSQHRLDQLDMHASPIAQLKKLAPSEMEVNLRTFLGSFAFSGDKIFEPITHFSGGEKARLALALLIWQRPNLLLLDEPTNHLDLDMRNALSLALQDFTGGMVLISHDRFLVRSTVDQLYLVADEEVNEFNGDMDDYHRWLLDYRQDKGNAQSKSTGNRKQLRQENAKLREERRPLLKKIADLEKQMQTIEKKLARVTEELSGSDLYLEENKLKLQQTLLLEAQLKKDLTQQEEAWLQACMQRDAWDE